MTDRPLYLVDDKECWIWQRAISSGGYGVVGVSRQRKTVRAHRWMYERLRGEIPAGAELDHLCRNRACVNPDHLEIVTHAVNGQRGLKTKLTMEQVNEMRRQARAGKNDSELARAFGVVATTARAAVNGRTWANATEPPATTRRFTGWHGDSGPLAKLSDAQVVEIRALQGIAHRKDLAVRFGIHPNTVNSIWARTKRAR